MIVGTSYSPQKAFVNFAREFLEHLANGNYGEALAKLDQSSRKWSKPELRSAISAALGVEPISSAKHITRSAEPELVQVQPGQYILRHRIPVASGWSKSRITFVFTQKPGTEYFYVSLNGVGA